MSTRAAHEAPAWLADFQAQFGDALRTPLDRASGTLTVAPGAARLAVYNRQYWFRLFGVLHDAFPLTARLLGYWDFNEHAAAYLGAEPPRTGDLDDVPERFAAFFVARVADDGSDERRAWCESARIDAAYRDVFHAAEVQAYRPSADDAAQLLGARLVPSPAVARIREHSALLDLRRLALAEGGVSRLALPPPLPAPRDFILVRTGRGITALPLEPREAELLALLAAHPVGEALARCEQACPPSERAELPANAQRWLARSVERGFWSGVALRPAEGVANSDLG